MTSSTVSAVVLAGGRSSRFGRDKLTEDIGGRRLLDLAIDAVRPHAAEIVVVVAPDAPPWLGDDVRVVRDEVAFEGPLVGLLAGLRAAKGRIVLAVGGDMPTLVPEVVAMLIAPLSDPEVDAVVLEHEGRPRPLPVAVRTDRAIPAADRLVSKGERRLRALVEDLSTTIVIESDWRRVDPDGRSVRDIDRPSDLDRSI
jgi:molybdenum cofactor guanylyltransferase